MLLWYWLFLVVHCFLRDDGAMNRTLQGLWFVRWSLVNRVGNELPTLLGDKEMRKSFVTVIVFMLMTSSGHAAWYASDFEDYVVGGLIKNQSSSWWDPSAVAEVAVDPLDSENQVLDAKALDSAVWMVGYGQNPDPAVRYITVEFDVYLSSDQVRSFTFSVTDNDSSDVTYVAFGASGADTISYSAGAGWIPQSYDYDPCSWIPVKMAVDQVTNTYDIYVNGDLVFDDVACMNDAITTERFVLSPRTDFVLLSGGLVLVDNINTYEPSVATSFCGDGTHSWLDGDISGPQGERDCYVNLYDLGKMAEAWLACSDPDGVSCLPYE